MSEYWSLASYGSLLAGLRDAGYRFIPFHRDLWEHENPSPDMKLCLLRHDIDTDLGAALSMARVENDLNVAATYFVMTRSPLYNLFSRCNHQHVREILAQGHHLGLHFDHGFDAGLQRSAVDQIDLEARFLEDLFEVGVSAVSFHQPGAAVLQGELSTGHRVNTYSKAQLKDFHYLSDSNRVFAPLDTASTGPDRIESWIRAAAPWIQILIHPMWWVYQESSTEQVWNRVIESNFERTQQQLLQTERAYGARRRIQLIQDGDIPLR
jgi:hypothetical protein